MAFPKEKLRQDALLCLIYMHGYKGNEDYSLKPGDAVRLLADFFYLSESERTRPLSGDRRSNWMMLVEGTRERLAGKGFILRPPPRAIWKLSQDGIEEARCLFQKDREFRSLKTIDHQTPVASDLIEPPETVRVLCKTYRVLRDTQRARRIKSFYDNNCQLCGITIRLSNGETYAEAHHIRPLGAPHNGPDVDENIICVCPNHHVELDYGAISLDKVKLGNCSKHIIGDEYIQYHNEKIYNEK